MFVSNKLLREICIKLEIIVDCCPNNINKVQRQGRTGEGDPSLTVKVSGRDAPTVTRRSSRVKMLRHQKKVNIGAECVQ